MQAKLKKLKAIRQNASSDNQKQINRRFLIFRMFIKNDGKPKLLAIEKAVKRQMLNSFFVGVRSNNKKIFMLSNQKSKTDSISSFTATENASLAISASASRLEFLNKKKKFILR